MLHGGHDRVPACALWLGLHGATYCRHICVDMFNVGCPLTGGAGRAGAKQAVAPNETARVYKGSRTTRKSVSG